MGRPKKSVGMKKTAEEELAMEEIREEEMINEEILIQKEREEREEEMWAHDPDTGERTFYFGCMI